MCRVVVLILLVLGQGARADDEEMPNAVPTVMYKRWAAAVSYGVTSATARTDAADRQILAFFELALRFRVIPELEVGASIGGSFSGSLGFATILGDARYRLFAERPWNPYVFGSIGIATWSAQDSSHLAARIGAGLERRFQQWAFSLGLEVCRVPEASTAVQSNPEERYGVWSESLQMSALYYWGSGGPSLRHHGVP